MDPTITAAIIGGTSTLVATVLGAVVGRTKFVERIFQRSKYQRLIGTKWESIWHEDNVDGSTVEFKEVFEFTWQRTDKVGGTITSGHYPDMKWTIEGDYNERFLRLFWQPSDDSPNKYFLDYGCYFLERNGNGTFTGYAIGFSSETNRVEAHAHAVRKVT
ncbi:MAG: hypothetical protein PHE60_07440 [Sulfurospirillaceae bacterium]|nr:hypothetical protein [Sulfurospirillaceae bacterium]